MSGIPAPRLRGAAFALEVIEAAEKRCHALGGKVSDTFGHESPIAKELHSIAWNLKYCGDLVKSDIAATTEGGDAQTP